MPPPTRGFKKGNVPPKRKPIGSERAIQNNIIEVKISEASLDEGLTGWRCKHFYVWEQVNGPVPPGMTVLFKDGNRGNFEIDNLMLIPRAVLLRLNYRQYNIAPDELKPSILALSRYEIAISKLLKCHQERRTSV
jgi:hypothetical protein